MLHFGQEITLLVAHVCIVTLFPRLESDVRYTFIRIHIDLMKSMFIQVYCKTAAVILQLMFIMNSAFIQFDALHTYTIITNVISRGKMFGYNVVFLACLSIIQISFLLFINLYSVVFDTMCSCAWNYYFIHQCILSGQHYI